MTHIKPRKMATGTAQVAPLRLPGWGAALRRQLVIIALLLGFALLLRDRIAALDWGAIGAAFAQVSGLQWSFAALASTGSFAALANYDALLHRALGTAQPAARARHAGWVVIAMSQTVGFGLISGALVRWRMLPGLSLREASRLTAAVAASFLAAWTLLCALVLIALPLPLAGHGVWAVRALAGGVLLAGGALCALALWQPGIKLARWHLRLPTLPVMGRIMWLCLLDTAFAALALWALLPTGSGIGALALYPAFLIALARRSLDWATIWDVLVKTGTISVGILLLLVAANFYGQMLAVAGIPAAISALVAQAGLGAYGFLLLYVLLVLLLGMILDSTSILLIVVPIAAPIALHLGFDLIHFGIITVIAVEVGLLTPPFGISIFTVHATLDDGTTTLESIFAGTLPFVGVMLAALVLIAAFPGLLYY